MVVSYESSRMGDDEVNRPILSRKNTSVEIKFIHI